MMKILNIIKVLLYLPDLPPFSGIRGETRATLTTWGLPARPTFASQFPEELVSFFLRYARLKITGILSLNFCFAPLLG